jgi:hypothetical protein
MNVVFHPDFPRDVKEFERDYSEISEGLAMRFRQEIESTVAAIKTSPTSAGHFLNTGSEIVRDLRRKNLKAFPFFVLYGVHGGRLIFGAVIPSRSDPLTWLARFR